MTACVRRRRTSMHRCWQQCLADFYHFLARWCGVVGARRTSGFARSRARSKEEAMWARQRMAEKKPAVVENPAKAVVWTHSLRGWAGCCLCSWEAMWWPRLLCSWERMWRWEEAHKAVLHSIIIEWRNYNWGGSTILNLYVEKTYVSAAE